ISFGFISIIGTGGSGGGGGGGGAPPSPPETAPTISDVNFYDAYENETYSFTIGEDANFRVYATDPDLDMISCEISQYHPHDSATPYYGPDTMSLPSQSHTDMVYYSIDPIEVTGPAGSWRIEFQIIDTKGNESNIWRVYSTVSSVSSDPLLAKTELLKGYWHFYYTIISTWNDYYTLDTITGDTNSQGGYYIYGTDKYGDLVIATYWPNDGDWSLLDPGTIIDQYYTFYTDGNTILANSCYYQINNSTGDWSSCYTLNGYKVYSILAIQPKGSVTEAIESEEMKAAEAEEIKTIQSIGETVSDSIKEKYRKMKQVIDSQK
ncbi:hypothetical protein KA005_32530, partial [bacterium]|nr:hypothetical protein [bacterium]